MSGHSSRSTVRECLSAPSTLQRRLGALTIIKRGFIPRRLGEGTFRESNCALLSSLSNSSSLATAIRSHPHPPQPTRHPLSSLTTTCELVRPRVQNLLTRRCSFMDPKEDEAPRLHGGMDLRLAYGDGSGSSHVG
jgi:hypothetical protein